MPLVVEGLLTILEHLCSYPVFSGVHVTRSLVLCVCFVDRCPFFHSLFVLFVLPFTNYDDPFGIFQFFLFNLSYKIER
jgi:hypothetical protein